MSEANRAETMAAKLAGYAERAHIRPDVLVAAYELSVARRLRLLGDVFHEDLLHPARTALILITDAGCIDDAVLTAATLVDTEFPELQPTQSEIRTAFGERVGDLVAAVPNPAGNEALLEDLVVAPHDVALIALAERLDHARHLHFRERALWTDFYAQINGVYLPLAGRLSPPIQQRLSHWSGAFAKRLARA